MEYSDFLEGKAFSHVAAGFQCGELPYPLFVHQSPIVRWALKRGKAAIFADTGYGKTIMQLSWADQVAQHTNGPVLVLAPLAVADQTIDEGAKYGIQIEKATLARISSAVASTSPTMSNCINSIVTNSKGLFLMSRQS